MQVCRRRAKSGRVALMGSSTQTQVVHMAALQQLPLLGGQGKAAECPFAISRVLVNGVISALSSNSTQAGPSGSVNRS